MKIMNRHLRTVAAFLAALHLLLLAGCGLKTGYTPEQVTIHRGAVNEPSPARPDSLHILCWNIQYAIEVDLALQEIKADSNMAAADIILLQEMDPKGARRMAEELGMYHVYAAASVSPQSKNLFGNAVLSRWPITDERVLTLPHETLLTGHRRIAVSADIDLGGLPIRVISIHTATVIMDQHKRVDQAKAARDTLGGFDGPVIIGGDFNTVSEYEGTLLRQTMRRLRLKQVRLPEGPTIANKYKKVPGTVPVLDHLFYKEFEAGSRGVARETTASDHYPIWVVLGVPDPAAEKE